MDRCSADQAEEGRPVDDFWELGRQLDDGAQFELRGRSVGFVTAR